MPLIVNTNVTSLTAQRHLAVNTGALAKTMEKLASGYRINRSGDDAAGLQLSENLRAQIRGMKKALDNTQDGINLLNILDGAYAQMQENYQRVRELYVQGANDTYSTAQRNAIVSEITQLLAENDRISESTQFNGIPLMNEQYSTMFLPGTGFRIQVGQNNTVNDWININTNNILGDMDVDNLGFIEWDDTTNTGATLTDNANAHFMMLRVETCMSQVNTKRGDIGALINRMEGIANNLMIGIENMSSSESRIRNVDVAAESATLVRNQILQQASSSILAQANQSPSLALQLLTG